MQKIFRRSLAVLTLVLAGSTMMFAQTTATLSGRVTDQQGANVSGATVTLHSRDNRV